MQDTTLRPICFGIDKTVTPATKAVGAQQFMRYEYGLYICAQLSRIVYCDAGIAWNVIQESLGTNSDEVNKTISKYDKQFVSQRRTPVTSQPGEPGTTGRPAESYSLSVGDGTNPYGAYISSPSDCTVLVVTGNALKPSPNSPFMPTDLFFTFKGSSTLKNFKHDIMSQFSGGELRTIAAAVMNNDVGNVPLAFAKPIMKVWAALMKALDAFATDGCRLFITGHSLGGASATLFGFILAEAKLSGTLPILNKIKSIHIVSFGAPTCVSDRARNEFNKHLDSGVLTFDRVVSQAVAARSGATQVLMGGILGPNDVIPNIPVGFAHPGFRPLATEFRPEANGRPYQMMNVRSYYGAPSKTNGRDPTTWPFGAFTEPPKPEGESVDTATADLKSVQVQAEESQTGGGAEKSVYALATKTYLPNFISVLGSAWARGFAHAEYLGMFFMGGFRLMGMKNPASKMLAYFILNNKGVQITYLPAAKNNAERKNNSSVAPPPNQASSSNPVSPMPSNPVSPVASNPVSPVTPPPKRRSFFGFGGSRRRFKKTKRSTKRLRK